MKIMIGTLALIQIFSMHMVGVEAYENDNYYIGQEIEESVSIASTTSKWFYRTYNGIRQKRLWSTQYNKWITDWINC